MTEPAATLAEPSRSPTAAARPPGLAGPLTLLGLGLLFTALLLAALRGTMLQNADPDSGIIVAANKLFDPATAALAVGIAAGLALLAYLGARVPSSTAGRLGVAALGGLGGGLVTAGLAVALLPGARPATWVAVTMGAVGLVGGLLTGIPQPRALAAGLAGTFAMFTVKIVIEWFVNENRNVVASIVTGLVAGLVAYWHLSRSSRRAGEAAPWPTYVIAGALSGLLTIGAALLAWLPGSRLLSSVEAADAYQPLYQALVNYQLIGGMLVLFPAALIVIILAGRNIQHPGKGAMPADRVR